MKKFIIRLHDGNYLMNVRLTSNYLEYDRTRERSQAHHLNNFDSQLVLRRLADSGEKKASRQEITDSE